MVSGVVLQRDPGQGRLPGLAEAGDPGPDAPRMGHDPPAADVHQVCAADAPVGVGGLAGPLAQSIAWHDPAAPMVLVVQRSRLVLRLALSEPRIAVLDGALSLGLAAAAAARRVAEEVSRGAVNSTRPSTWGAVPAPPKEPGEI